MIHGLENVSIICIWCACRDCSKGASYFYSHLPNSVVSLSGILSLIGCTFSRSGGTHEVREEGGDISNFRGLFCTSLPSSDAPLRHPPGLSQGRLPPGCPPAQRGSPAGLAAPVRPLLAWRCCWARPMPGPWLSVPAGVSGPASGPALTGAVSRFPLSERKTKTYRSASLID